jgi:predicted nucleic acid-binding protein
MKVIVPDASILLKWVLPSLEEEDQQKALKIRDLSLAGELTLIVPTLWLYEVGNILSRRFPEDASDSLQALLSYGLDEIPWNRAWLDKCFQITERFGVTFYDAAYHSLALRERALFVTADQKYVLKTEALGGVVSLRNWT